MEASWMAKKNSMMSNTGMSENEAAAYATSHLISESIGRNIYNAADDKLFDNNGKLIATRLTGYDDLDWQDAIERNGHRQEYNLSAAASGQKYNVYSSVGYLNEKGYVKATVMNVSQAVSILLILPINGLRECETYRILD
jgi:lactate dehydrogenase-like 2-hydroxyacid dehydrogenase